MKKKRVTQRHHIVYGCPDHPEQEKIVRIYKGEHEILSKMNLYTRKSVSRGFLAALAIFIVMNSDRAEDIKDD
jgi:hypothetical protein